VIASVLGGMGKGPPATAALMVMCHSCMGCVRMFVCGGNAQRAYTPVVVLGVLRGGFYQPLVS